MTSTIIYEKNVDELRISRRWACTDRGLSIHQRSASVWLRRSVSASFSRHARGKTAPREGVDAVDWRYHMYGKRMCSAKILERYIFAILRVSRALHRANDAPPSCQADRGRGNGEFGRQTSGTSLTSS